MDDLILGDSLEVLIDHRGKTPKKLGGDFTTHGVPVASAMLVQDGRLRIDEARSVASELYQRWMPVHTKRHDVILTSEAPLGRVALVPDDNPLVLGQRLFGLRGQTGVLDSLFLFYALQTESVQNELQGRATGTTVTGIRQSELLKVRIPAPSFQEQQAIAAVLGALDDKIAVNDRVAATARDLAATYFSASLESGSEEYQLFDLAELISRGVTPRYSDDHTQLLVLNQKCIRNGRVGLAPSRRTLMEKVPAQKVLQPNDVLVNSTGVGTLGRVARWTFDLPGTVDSHITIVRFDTKKTDPVCAGFALLAAESEIETLGEGSTGQTELSRTKLGLFRLSLPIRSEASELRPKLDALEARSESTFAESLALAQLRDTLLPKLMSGELRVRDAEKIVEDAA